MQRALESMEIIRAMAETGLEASISDVGVGALCARTAVMGAYLNVRINAAGLEDRSFAGKYLEEGAAIQQQALEQEAEILRIVNSKIKD